MSKPCPSTKSLESPAIWKKRVYRNSYTRGGQTHYLKGWYYKLQVHGHRKTFALVSQSRADAAMEARRIHEMLSTNGWSGVGALTRDAEQLVAPGTLGQSDSDALPPLSLTHRAYREARLPENITPGEYTARIQHRGAYAYFPLATEDKEEAGLIAAAIQQVVRRQGWQTAFRAYEREVTLAVSWSENPFAVTYTTLYTYRNRTLAGKGNEKGEGAPPASGASPDTPETDRKLIAVLEPDLTTHNCLRHWLGRQTGFACKTISPGSAQLFANLEIDAPAVVLVNSTAPDEAQTITRLRDEWPNVPIFRHRIHPDSDQIFITTSGVRGGYILRRRPPLALFEPIQPVSQTRSLSVADTRRAVRDYFQNFFAESGFNADHVYAPGGLTLREQEILTLVSRGCSDKEVANNLKISIWTVHNHLKNIYEKLGSHNRTEAVLKFLQR